MTKYAVLYYFLLTYYLLTPWSKVILDKLASLQLVKKFPAFYGTQRFLTALTSARHLYYITSTIVKYYRPLYMFFHKLTWIESRFNSSVLANALKVGLQNMP